MADTCDELHRHISSLRRYAMALTRHPADADDLVQETLRRAISFLRNGHEIRQMRSYLFSILHNVRATQLRGNGRALVHLPIEDFVERLPAVDDPSAHVEMKALLSALRELPQEQREVMLLVGLEGFAYREAAAILGIPIGTVMSRLARARKVLTHKMWGDGAVDGESATLRGRSVI